MRRARTRLCTPLPPHRAGRAHTAGPRREEDPARRLERPPAAAVRGWARAVATRAGRSAAREVPLGAGTWIMLMLAR